MQLAIAPTPPKDSTLFLIHSIFHPTIQCTYLFYYKYWFLSVFLTVEYWLLSTLSTDASLVPGTMPGTQWVSPNICWMNKSKKGSWALCGSWKGGPEHMESSPARKRPLTFSRHLNAICWKWSGWLSLWWLWCEWCPLELCKIKSRAPVGRAVLINSIQLCPYQHALRTLSQCPVSKNTDLSLWLKG